MYVLTCNIIAQMLTWQATFRTALRAKDTTRCYSAPQNQPVRVDFRHQGSHVQDNRQRAHGRQVRQLQRSPRQEVDQRPGTSIRKKPINSSLKSSPRRDRASGKKPYEGTLNEGEKSINIPSASSESFIHQVLYETKIYVLVELF